MLAGTEYAGQCFCGNALVGSQPSSESGCNMACTGKAGEICGGGGRLSVYKKSSGLRRRERRGGAVGKRNGGDGGSMHRHGHL